MNVSVVNGSVMNVVCCEWSVLNRHPSKYSFTIAHHYYNKYFGKNMQVFIALNFCKVPHALTPLWCPGDRLCAACR